ncbi:putative Zn finger protein [Methanocalculus alkaliphilus]|uniref:HVO_0476 family zinc finger protein n=1 Tax=Methanocalculus alkaliphilus TaxID=768730 RepID=UPI0020A13598|nr:HVO_0476 family zinc finger protein [Methanocalculus alkaliphilus]MCP1714854.1 putative Zn finger protein [Methanocalculus alkaliphilus]
MSISIRCPGCEEETDHDIVRDGSPATVRCCECDHIHRITITIPAIREIPAIVSSEAESKKGVIELTDDELVNVGDTFVADVGDDIFGVEVTGIEIGPARRRRASVKDITCLWTRVVDTVIIRASLHKGATTIPLYEAVDGETAYTIGEITDVGGRQFRVTRIKMRDGQVIRKPGSYAEARFIKRIYGERS